MIKFESAKSVTAEHIGMYLQLDGHGILSAEGERLSKRTVDEIVRVNPGEIALTSDAGATLRLLTYQDIGVRLYTKAEYNAMPAK